MPELLYAPEDTAEKGRVSVFLFWVGLLATRKSPVVGTNNLSVNFSFPTSRVRLSRSSTQYEDADSAAHVKQPPSMVHQRAHGNYGVEFQATQGEDVNPELLASLKFGQRLAAAGLPDLIYTLKRPMDRVVNLGTLQRMNLLSLQDQLLRIVARIDESKVVDPDTRLEITTTLSAYATAVRDRELAASYSAKAGNDVLLDPFIIFSAKVLQRKSMEDMSLLGSRRQYLERPVDGDLPQLPGDEGKSSDKVRTVEELLRICLYAVIGCILLVALMMSIVLCKDEPTTLLNISISVAIFGLLLTSLLY